MILPHSTIHESRKILLVSNNQRRFGGGAGLRATQAAPSQGRHTMNCTRIALYDITSGSYDEVVDQAKAGMAPLFQHSPGFVSYGVAQIDKTAFVSLSTWKTREQADAAP